MKPLSHWPTVGGAMLLHWLELDGINRINNLNLNKPQRFFFVGYFRILFSRILDTETRSVDRT
jgi:hypothetical protein